MREKMCKFICLGVVLLISTGAYAANVVFSDANGTGLWSDAGNWSAVPVTGDVPYINADCHYDVTSGYIYNTVAVASSSSAAVPTALTVDSGTILSISSNFVTGNAIGRNGIINVYGTTYTHHQGLFPQKGKSTVNVYDGGYMHFGYVPGDAATGVGTLNMGNLGGADSTSYSYVNLYDGSTLIATSLQMGLTLGVTCQINIEEGATLILGGNYADDTLDNYKAADVAAYLSHIVAMGGGTLQLSYDAEANYWASDWNTDVTGTNVGATTFTVVPEPLTLSLLCFGSLFMLKRRK